jgi:hypothetical protein
MLTSESYDRKQKPGSDEFKILLDNLVKEKNKRQREQYFSQIHRLVEEFFKKNGIDIWIFPKGEGEDVNFSPKGEDANSLKEYREKYFKNIKKELPTKSLIFVDPDTGIAPEIKQEQYTKRAEYILFNEIEQLYIEESILMIYQHFGRNKDHTEQLKDKRKALENKFNDIKGSCIASIDNNEIIFFFLTRSPEIYKKLCDRLESYATDYKLHYVK